MLDALAKIFAMSGLEGRMYQPLAAAVVAALGASLALALTVVPLLAGWILRPSSGGPAQDTWIVSRIKRAYAPSDFARMAALSRFEDCETRPSGIGIDVWLRKPARMRRTCKERDFSPLLFV